MGTCDHLSSGDTAIGPAAIVNLFGMMPPSSQAVVVMINGGVWGPRPRPCPPPPCAPGAGACATVEAIPTASHATATERNVIERTTCLCILFSSSRKFYYHLALSILKAALAHVAVSSGKP